MKTMADYQQENGSYDEDRVVLDAFDGNTEQYEAFLAERLNCRINGTPLPVLPAPYEDLYQQVHAFQLAYIKAHLPELRREHRKEFGFYPIVIDGE